MILLTGATGFVGGYVVRRLLEQRQELILIVRNRGKYNVLLNEILVEGNLDDPDVLTEKLRKYKIDTCIHLAWEGIPDYSFEMSRKNLNYGINVLMLCRTLGIKHLVITGSCWEYESPAGCINTNSKLSADNSFKAAKNALHMIAHSFCKENGIILNWIRLFYVYGPGQRKGALIPHIMRSFAEGKQPELNGAYNKNDFIYVSDAADAIAKAAQNIYYPETLNCGSGMSTEVLEIVKITAELMQKDFDGTIYIKNGNETDFYADSREMIQSYQWSCHVNLRDGIRYMLEQNTLPG